MTTETTETVAAAPVKAPVVAYTDAPDAFDWGWCRTEAENVAVADSRRAKPRVLRRVVIEDEWHARYQIGRYHSGNYYGLTPSEYLAGVDAGWIAPNPESEWVVHRRGTVVVPSIAGPVGPALYGALTALEAKNFPRTEIRTHYRGRGVDVDVYVVGDARLFWYIYHTLKAAAGVP